MRLDVPAPAVFVGASMILAAWVMLFRAERQS
jgi:hypothetical protein